MTSMGGVAGSGMAECLLEVEDLSVSFPTEDGVVRAVRGVSYRLGRGEALGIVGESGSGKSVAALAVMGLLPPAAQVSGSVRWRGRQLLGRPDRELSQVRGRRIAMIFQDPLTSLNPVYPVGLQIAEAITAHDPAVSRRVALDRAVDLLDVVGIPHPRQRARAYPHELSGGMRQRVVIAVAMANDPDVIIADEPTTALDVTVQAQVLQALETARERTAAALVLITHDLGVIAGHAERVAVMYAGRLVETGTVEEIFYAPRMPYTLGLLASVPRVDTGRSRRLMPITGSPPSLLDLPPGCPFRPRCPHAEQICAQVEPGLEPVGSPAHRSACHFRDRISGGPPAPALPRDVAAVPGSAPLLEVRDLVKHFPVRSRGLVRRRVGEVHAVCGVSFDVHPHETLGLVGESGCGKTTTARLAVNLLGATSGDVRYAGRAMLGLSARRMRPLRRDVQIVFQDPFASLDPRMSVNEIVAEPLRVHGAYGPGGAGRDRVRELLRQVGLNPEHGNRFPHEFSGGQRQRIGVARALATRPRLLVLDEPVSALDVSIQAGVLNMLADLQAELGLAYLFISHDLAVVRHIADRVAVMYLGRLVEVAPTAELFARGGHPYTQALVSAIPVPDPYKERARERIILAGDVPSPVEPPSGCRFRTRCPMYATRLSEAERSRCRTEVPELIERDAVTHPVACHYARPLRLI
jgi:peptide/nickel transport system ATP-binding protein